MRAVVEDAWSSISSEEIGEIVDTMPARVQAVIAAQGSYARFELFRVFCLLVFDLFSLISYF